MSDAFLALNHWAKTGPSDEFWFWAVGLTAVATVSFFFAFYKLHKKRLIEDIPTSRIRSAAQGYLELTGFGKLMDGQPIVAPLTGMHCTWYQFSVEEKVKQGKNNNWKTIRKGTSDELFLICDETGECVIDPEGAHVITTNKDVWYGNQVTPMQKPLSTSKWRHIAGGAGRYRYTERRLETGEPLYAIGLFKTVGGSGAKLDVNADVRELIRDWKQDSETMLKHFDTNQDGEIDLEEWQKLREAAYQQVLENHNEQKTLPPVHIMNRTRDTRRPFILSAVPQEHLTRKLLWLSILYFMVFLACGIASIWIISVRLAT